MAGEHKFSFEKRDGIYYLLDKGKQVITPKGVVVCTKSERLAEALVEDGNATNGCYTSPTSILCFHYSALDFGLTLSDSDKEEQINAMLWSIENDDPFLEFRQNVPFRQVLVSHFVDELTHILPKLTVYQLMCFVILTTNLNSPMLAHYIVSEFVNIDVNIEFEDWKSDFLEDLKEYCDDNYLNFDREWYDAMIVNFVDYFFNEEI